VSRHQKPQPPPHCDVYRQWESQEREETEGIYKIDIFHHGNTVQHTSSSTNCTDSPNIQKQRLETKQKKKNRGWTTLHHRYIHSVINSVIASNTKRQKGNENNKKKEEEGHPLHALSDKLPLSRSLSPSLSSSLLPLSSLKYEVSVHIAHRRKPGIQTTESLNDKRHPLQRQKRLKLSHKEEDAAICQHVDSRGAAIAALCKHLLFPRSPSFRQRRNVSLRAVLDESIEVDHVPNFERFGHRPTVIVSDPIILQIQFNLLHALWALIALAVIHLFINFL